MPFLESSPEEVGRFSLAVLRLDELLSRPVIYFPRCVHCISYSKVKEGNDAVS